VVERRRAQPWLLRFGRLDDLIGLRLEACLCALDADLNRLGERIQKAGEGGDERGLLVGASQLETRRLRTEQQAVTRVGQLDEPRCEDAADRDVERSDPWLTRCARRRCGERFGCEYLPFRGEREAGKRERELVARESVVTNQCEEHAADEDDHGRCERDRCWQ
jgi:hypothetical protein